MKRISAYLIPRLAQRFFAVSQHARQAYLDRGIPGHLVRVLYNPVNMELCRFDPQQRSEHRKDFIGLLDGGLEGRFGFLGIGAVAFSLLQSLPQMRDRRS